MAGNLVEYASPSLAGLMDNALISVISPESLGDVVRSLGTVGAWASGAITQNTAYFYPVHTSAPMVVSKFFWVNGSTVNGNTDVGIYSESGTLLGHCGSTANSGASSWQTASPTAAFELPPNSRLWIAVASDSATHTYFGWGLTTGALNLMGCKVQASAWSSGLPSSGSLSDSNSATVRFVGLSAQSVL